MNETLITDEERQLLVVLVMRDLINLRCIPDMEGEAAELEGILRKITGTDKQLIVRS